MKNQKSLFTTLAIIGIPAIVVLAIPDVGSLLVFTAFFIALFREGLSGWVFGVGAILAAVFLVALAVDPLYVIIGISLIFLIIIFFNYHRIHWNVVSISGFIGSFLLLSGIAFATPKILENTLPFCL